MSTAMSDEELAEHFAVAKDLSSKMGAQTAGYPQWAVTIAMGIILGTLARRHSWDISHHVRILDMVARHVEAGKIGLPDD